MLTTTICIDRLKLYAHHGVFPQEQTVGNWFEVTIAVAYPTPENAAGSADDSQAALSAVEEDTAESLAATADYSRLCDIAREQMAVPTPLLETVATRIRRAVLAAYPFLTSISVRIAKLTPPIGANLAQCFVQQDWTAG